MEEDIPMKTRDTKKYVSKILATVIMISMVLPVGFFSAAPLVTGTNQKMIDADYYVVKTFDDSQRQSLQGSGLDITLDYGSQALCGLTENQAEMLADSGFEIEKVETTIFFQTVAFDTKNGEPALSEDLTAESDYYVVQFIGPIVQEWKAQLEALGAINTDHYWSNHAYIIKMDETTKRQVEALPFINWVGQFQPAYKFAHDLSEFEPVDTVLVDVFKNEDINKVVAKIKSLGATLDEEFNYKVEYDSQGRFVIDTSRLPELARLDEVSVIAKYVQPRVMNDQAATEYCTAANLAWYKETSGFDVPTNTWGGLTGYGQVVGITDTGFDTGSASSGHYDMFNGPLGDRVVGVHRSGGCSGNTDDHLHAHGTHVTGIVAANGYCAETFYGMDTTDHVYGGDHVFAGMAPEASVSINAAGDNAQDGGLCPVTPNCWNTELADGAHIHTNSWGGGSGYSGSAVDADQFMWSNRDDVVFCAAGNAGPDASSIGPPASAKNDMTVGASGNYRPAYKFQSDPNLIVPFSSRGPFPASSPNRYEPDICAPGHYVVSLTATNYKYDLGDSDGDGDEYNDPYRPEDCSISIYQTGLVKQDYQPFSGTSMASPAAAGVTALIRQYYTDMFIGNLPGTPGDPDPSGILLKASGIHGGIDMGFGFPSNDQGWGRMNIKDSLFPTAPATMQFFDHRTGISSGVTWNAQTGGSLNTNIQSDRVPLKVTLVTLDTQGNSGRLSNDLDLRVTSPSATIYRGNNFIGEWSIPGGSDDDQMLVERVLIPAPESGAWTIEVVGETTPVGNTPFAILITADFGPQVSYNVEMEPEFATVFACVAGGSTTFRYNLLNFGTQDDTIALSENNLPAGFVVTYNPTSPVNLLSNEDTDVTVLIEVDASVLPKAYTFEFAATSQNDTATPPSQDRIQVICEVLEFPLPKLIRVTTSPASEGEPAICTHYDGSNDYIFIAYNKYDENGPHVYLRYSTDYGNSWTERQASTPNDGATDPKIVVYPPTSPSYPNRVVILWHGSDPAGAGDWVSYVYCAYSNPPYNTWTQQRVIATDSGTSDAHTSHRRVAAAIYMGGTGNEELIVTIECLGASNTIDICDVYSTTGGASWSGWGATKPAATANPDFFQEMTTDQNGDVFMANYRSQGGAVRREVYLTNYNGGGNWGAQTAVTNLNTNWNDCFPAIWSSDEGPSNNRLYVTKLYTTQDPPDPPFTIYQSHSDNTGTSWSSMTGPYGTSASQAGYPSGRPLSMGVYTPTDGRNWLTREEEPTGGTGENPFPVPNIHTQFTTNGFTTAGLFKVTADAVGKDHPTFDSIGDTVYHAFGAQYVPGNKDVWMAVYSFTDVQRQGDPDSVPDLQGPDTYNLGIVPDPSLFPLPALLTATIDDTDKGFHPIQAAEYDLGPIPYPTPSWPGTAMNVADGLFNTPIESVWADIDTSGLSFGNYTVWIRGQDDQGNWGTAVSINMDLRAGENQDPTLYLQTPNGGEVWMGGSSQMITWTMDDLEDPNSALTVVLDYSSTGPLGPWTPITTVVGVESYNWDPLPVLDSSNCYIRANVTDTETGYFEHISNASFIIDSTAPLPATYPNAELDGTGVRINWTASSSPDVDHYTVYWIMNNWDGSGDTYTNNIPAFLSTDVLHANVGINNPSSYCYQIRTYDIAGHETRTMIQAAKFGSTESTIANPTGWFLLGCPLIQSDTSVAHTIQGQGLPANWDCLQTFDGATDTWYTQVKGSPATTVTDIYTDQGFWLHLTSSSRFATTGTITDKAIPLYTGWNLVAYPFAQRFMTSATIQADLTANCPNFVEMMIADHTQPYHIDTPSGTENIFQNQAFWVLVSADTTWTVLNY
jgi:hypothetical protein